jgi:predicted enzyme related to lactoylglutathione lyase
MPPEPVPVVRLSYVSLFTRDVEALPDFYIAVFGLTEVEASRSDRYRELMLGELKLGFPSIDAYAVLDMADQADPTGVRALVTFAADSPAAVDTLTARAAAHGGRQVKGPFTAGFGQYLCVFLDPEGNAFRISAPSAQ